MWTRIVIHLAAAAESLGEVIGNNLLLCPSGFDYPALRASLATEICELPLMFILTGGAPEAYQQEWERQVAAWSEANETGSSVSPLPNTITEDRGILTMTALSTIFSTLRGAIKVQRQQATESYASIVIKLADGKAPKPEEAQASLEAEGRTLDELEADVKWVANRDTRRLRMNEQAKASKDFPSLASQVAEGDAELERLVAAHEQKMQPIVDKLNAIKAAKNEVELIEEELVHRSKDPALLAEQRDISIRQREIGRESQTLTDTLAKMRERLRHAHAVIGQPQRWEAAAIGHAREQVQHLPVQIDTAEGRLRDINKEVEKLNAAYKAAEAKKGAARF